MAHITLSVFAILSIVATFSWAWAITFVEPSHSLQRGFILLCTTAIAARIQYGNPDFLGNSIYNGLLLSWMWILHFRAFDLLFCTDGGVYLTSEMTRRLQNIPLTTVQSPASRLFRAWSLIFNIRNVSTPWAIKGLAESTSNPLPNRKFIIQRLIHGLGVYILLDAMFTLLPPVNPEVDVPEYKQYLFSRMNDVTLEELITRPLTVIGPALGIYAIFTTLYDIMSITAVLCFNDNPHEWPPLFGNITEGYTLRRFWG
jgi:hypothetical protein